MYRNGIEVIYFAYKPDDKLYRSLKRLADGKLLPEAVRVFLTLDDRDFAEKSEHNGDLSENECGNDIKGSGIADRIKASARGIPKVGIEYIRHSEFRHGGTRQLATESSPYEKVLLITQDAVPYDDRLLEKLDEALDNNDAACAYARQTAYSDADDIEKIYRRFNYPLKSRSKTASDIEKIGIKAFFCSDVCCMYRHDIFDKVGGFDRSLKFNEDSIFAFHALKAGYTVEYVADAVVYHSHNDPLDLKFKRSRDLAASQKEHPEVFGCVSSEHEGIRFLSYAVRYLIKKKNFKGIAGLFLSCAAKYAGYFAGKHFKT